MIRPIIVVGMNRSGTKWVSNIICSHDEVVGVQSRRTGGILETNMLGTMQEKFDLSYPDDYVGLIELWSRTEFFRRAGIEREMFYRLSPRPRSVFRVFELLMDELARRRGKKYWLQKTQPVRAPRVLEHFPNARVVVVRRNLLDTVRSTLALQRRHGRENLFRATWRYVYESKLLDRVCRRPGVIEVQYDALLANPEREKARLLTGLGLDAARTTREAAFPRNTSFTDESQRRRTLPRRDQTVVRIVALAVGLVPLPVISAGIALRSVWRGRRPPPLVQDTFGEVGEALVDRSRGDHP